MRRFDGSRLRQVRLARHLTPEQLAVSIGRSAPTIHAYEHGRIVPSTPALAALADALKIPVDDLFTVTARAAA